MTALVFVDTDILIDVGRGIDEAAACLQAIEQQSPMAISVVTQMELIVGCRNKSELNALEHFLDRFEIVGINDNISQTAVDLLKRYRLSHGLLIADALIAATAISEDGSLVSKNQRDYRFIEPLRLLSYPNPFE
ncbi:MAG: type II toxin-antitoxin system VapC family toxin [Desulfobacteraceae bacterium]|nr:type II toxin-antitoxin system VapC family toxin [Desulfobacteraceae bacterium]